MKILVTGATGFLGRHTVAALLAAGHRVLAASTNVEKYQSMPWRDNVDYVPCDLMKDPSPVLAESTGCDAVVHLAWAGLPNFQAAFHITDNLAADLRFLEAVMKQGVKHVLVTGTCFEYGLQYGPISEDAPTQPCTAYGIAKDCLRKATERLALLHDVKLQWLRLFYVYGEGQPEKTLLASLQKAIDEGAEEFAMSQGEQLRDYLPITEVASIIAFLMDHKEISGPIHACSGHPISIRRLVEAYCAERQAKIRLALGRYPYPEYEPLAFWGVPGKLQGAGYEGGKNGK